MMRIKIPDQTGVEERSMRKAAKQIILCAVGLVLFCIVCRAAFFNQFHIYVPVPAERQENIQLRTEQPEVLRIGEAEKHDGFVKVPVYPDRPGEADLMYGSGADGAESLVVLRVDRFHTVYDMNTGNFTGDTAVLIAVTLFWLLVSAIMMWHFFRAKGALFYDYGSIYYAGFSLFALASGLVMLSVTVTHFAHPETYSMYSAYSAISGASTRYMLMTMPLMLLFAGAMAVSNIALLRHERPRIQNLLGLLVSVMLVIGEALGWFLFSRDFMGSEMEARINSTLKNTYATVFVYFQCMLTGAVICGIKAARNRPAPDKDFIIIHGCWFRPDGTLPPLLRGRADRALEFWHAQKEKTGREARFIPSGGQGGNEPMAEAEAIRQYLLSRGMEDRLILPEDQSMNTYENMDFSRKIIEEENPESQVVFATSSYHVFRSGLWARQAGLTAEGIGSKTKWWFWPNAFMRETVGLMQKRWKQELLFLVTLIAFFGTLSMVLW